MKYCPNCGAKLSDNANFCPFCGAKLEDYEIYEGPKLEIAPEIICRHCGKGKMMLVDAESDIPLYMCPHCGWYYGDFLGTGKAIYYDSLHLKIGRIIKAEIRMRGHLRVTIKAGKNLEEEGLTEMAKYLHTDLQDYDLSSIRDALVYLMEEEVVKSHIERIDDEFLWFGVSLVDSN